MKPAQTRTKGRRELDSEAILKAAVRLIRRGGVGRLTMRAIAAELAVSPMALYHHVPSKQALLDRIRERSAELGLGKDRKSARDLLEARPALTEARIVQEGLAMVREQGAENLTMRGLAKRLGIAPMALYNHVSSHDDLIDRLRDAVLASIDLPAPSADRWREQMRDFTTQAVIALADHPGLLRAGSRRPPSPSERRLIAYGISVLLEAGFEPRQAALAYSAYQAQAFGFSVFADRQPPRPASRRRSQKAREPAGDPVVETGWHLQQLDLATTLEYALDALLDGLEARLEKRNSTRDAHTRGTRRAARPS